jgi:LacI family transcriptional regulator
MKDIANDLGVSLMTVSKALRSHTDISEETRRRVVARAKELDYRPNRIAQGLVNGRSYLVGLVIPDLMHSFFAEVARGISRRLNPLGYQVVISNSEASAVTEDRQIELLMSQRVDGLIIASSHVKSPGAPLERLMKTRPPFVLIDRRLSGVTAHFVGVDDEEIGALATGHLLEQGYQKVAHIKGPEVGTGIGRLRGYRKTLRARGLPCDTTLVVPGRTEEGGYAAMKLLLSRQKRPDAVFCFNDPVATGAMGAILEAGLRIPEDIALAGAGNVHYSDLLRIPLTTVDQCSDQIGECAADLLIESMEAKKPVAPRTILFKPRLIERKSSRRL